MQSLGGFDYYSQKQAWKHSRTCAQLLEHF